MTALILSLAALFVAKPDKLIAFKQAGIAPLLPCPPASNPMLRSPRLQLRFVRLSWCLASSLLTSSWARSPVLDSTRCCCGGD